MFAAPPRLRATLHARLPDELRKVGETAPWILARGELHMHSFLEGPAFDRDGNFYCVDIPFGRIFRLTPQGIWSVFAEYDGEPNGLKIHRDGRLFVADRKRGLLSFDPKTAQLTVVLERPYHEYFRGLNDLVFASGGDLYFTDMGASDLMNPTGRLFRLRAGGELDLLCRDLPGPNGLVLNRQETVLFVATTSENRVLSVPLRADYKGVGKIRVFVQMSGGIGPDGMAADDDDNLAIAHAGLGAVWIFSRLGEPLYRIDSCAGPGTTNVAYGGPDRRTLFITESAQGVIMKASLPVCGRSMYSHQA